MLRRELGLPGAAMMGLGAMMGTGVFVTIGVGAGVAGPALPLALLLSAVVAICSGLSSAQLAAAHPVSGGTYEYGYKYLNPAFGFTAGWLFLCAKTASAATAALGVSGYLGRLIGSIGNGCGCAGRLEPLAVLVALAVTAVVFAGIRQSNVLNIAVVSITMASLFIFVIFAAPSVDSAHLSPLLPEGTSATRGFLEACALMFVAYTGYGRIATLGEEVKEPQRNIPRAIIAATLISAAIYIAVGMSAVGAYGAGPLAEETRSEAAPLESVLRALGHPAAARWIVLGALTAMLGVLLNLILGLSRVMLAMGRRGDLPRAFARLNRSRTTPLLAVGASGLAVAGLAMTGDVKLTWSFSAFTVLLYYFITNLAALRQPASQRLYPRAVAWAGLGSCLFLAFWVEIRFWLTGLSFIGVGLLWHAFARARR
jgi:APA family basic amino acid/polyamine antiporter